jgi:hypothetical protein
MKKIILLVFYMPLMAYGQIIENFETGIPDGWVQSAEGHWSSDTISALDGKYSLHHVFDNSSSGSDCIGIQINDLHPEEGVTIWKFLIRHDCDPSSSNNWSVFLMSDTDPGSLAEGASANGFAVGVNLTGYDDTLRLWKIEDGSVSVIIKCRLNWQSDIGIAKTAGIIVERTGDGSWSISVLDDDDNLISAGYGSDKELFSAFWFILNYKYTSTRDRLIWLDDVEINGVFYKDTEPPQVTECRIKGKHSLEILFSEEPDEHSLVPENFTLEDNFNQVTLVTRNTKTSCVLNFSGEFRNKIKNNITINSLCDIWGNCSEDMGVKFIPVWAEAGDMIISEIMADPLPEVSLPGREYIEIYNRSSFSFNLSKWRFTTGDQETLFPEIVVDPDDYFILCSVKDTSLFSEYGHPIGLKPFPALTDEGKIIFLSDSLGNLIHGLEYSGGWYGSKLKEGGGWSLEIIDKDFPFFTEGNWEASSSVKGGTPGKINSAPRTNQDLLFYGIKNVFPEDSITISVDLSETVFGPEKNTGWITIEDNTINSETATDPLFRRFLITTSIPMPEKQVYILHLSGEVYDFAGNIPVRSSYRFGMPEHSDKGDVVFNELLFNPLPDCPDYIEFYNCSDKVIDVSRLYLSSVNEAGDTSEIFQVSGEPRCFMPHTYYVVTTDPAKIIAGYFTSNADNIYYARSLPSMPDNRGHLLLFSRELDIIDEVIYSEAMHYSLLSGTEGISLEKIRPQIASDNSLNWHSASESSGWGTPGTENSVYSDISSIDDQILFSSGRISPDNDGYEDVLVIDFNLEGLGNVITVTIFDETGGYIRRLTANLYAGSAASIVWDGTSGDGKLVNSGIYIILVELFNDKGKTKSWKKVCTVIR